MVMANETDVLYVLYSLVSPPGNCIIGDFTERTLRENCALAELERVPCLDRQVLMKHESSCLAEMQFDSLEVLQEILKCSTHRCMPSKRTEMALFLGVYRLQIGLEDDVESDLECHPVGLVLEFFELRFWQHPYVCPVWTTCRLKL